MELIVVRHGIAIDRDDPRCPPDPKRHLTEKGIRRTERAAAGLSTIIGSVDRILYSPYLRALQTAEIIATELDTELAPDDETTALLPSADPEELFELLRAHADVTTIAVGHGPNVDHVIAWALTGRTRPISHLKKAGAAALEILDIDTPLVRLNWFLAPRILRRLGGSS